MIAVGIAGQTGADRGTIHSASLRRLDQHCGIADVRTVEKIAAKQGLNDRILAIFQICPMDQTMRIDAIGCDGNRIEVKRDFVAGAGFANSAIDAFRTLGATELCFQIFLAINPLDRHVGVELERMPGDGWR